MYMCDWSDAEQEGSELEASVQRRERASTPLFLLSATDTPEAQRIAAKVWVTHNSQANPHLESIHTRSKKGKIRIAYYSADFREHPASFLAAELFKTHDREKFETFTFSFGPDSGDDMRLRVEAAFDKFVDVRSKSDLEIAMLSRSLEIDIAIDLAGFTQDSRAGIFAARAAPIQVSYLGYLGTMGADYIDYLFANNTIIPHESRGDYVEKIAYLPSYQVNDSKRQIADRVFSRTELGLPDTGFVFCCFNNNFKILPATFAGWMRILKQVDGSVLFLYSESNLAAENLKEEAAKQGIHPDRIIFGNKIPRPEYLARYRAADLFLDTWPYNAGTTASDALWAGLPVLTLTGRSFASRVAASLLNAIHLPELITSTQGEYENLAVELATDPQHLADIKQTLENNRLSTPLFNTQLTTRSIEAAYEVMYEHYQYGLPPEHIATEHFTTEQG